jgi:hypothetical protein
MYGRIKNKGPKADSVLVEFMKNRKNEALTILSSDKVN